MTQERYDELLKSAQLTLEELMMKDPEAAWEIIEWMKQMSEAEI